MGNRQSGTITKSSAIEGEGNQENSNNSKPINGGFLCNFKNLPWRIYAFLFSAKPRKPDPILPVQNPVSTSPSDFVLEQEVKIDVPSLECSLENRDGSDNVVNEGVSIQNDQSVSLECVFQHKNGSDDVVDESLSNDNKITVINSEVKVEDEKEIKYVVDEGKWIKYYHSSHKILLVGEGDFSFSASLALAFGSASNMIATSLNSQKFLKKNYGNAMVNIKNLTSKGCLVMHGIDATQIAGHNLLGCMVFDRIIFNFPFAGFFKDLSRDEQLRKHRRLVSLFLKNAKKLIDGLGEIHISHKTNGFHKEWNLENIASSHGLRLIEEAKFNQLDYPGYNTKCGFGGDGNFNCNHAKTYKFGLK